VTIFLLLAVLAAPPAAPQNQSDASDLINTLLASLGGFRDLSGPELQKEVADAGGIPFRTDVPLDYLSRGSLSTYIQELLDTEYPADRAEADERTLLAFDLLPPHPGLRALRARLLEDNVAGFYDERPGKKRLYAISDERTLTPANQLVLAHELRHALQDQYADLHGTVPSAVGDFDDRRMAFVSLLEGDATLVMERFLMRRLPGLPESMGDLGPWAMPANIMPGVPQVLQDQLVQPYLVGRDFARALLERGGWDALKQAWSRPPLSTEQVLHPEKYFAGEPPRTVDVGPPPPGARVVNEGVLGELLTRTLLGAGSDDAAAGWGGDFFRVYDVGGRTLHVWASAWDSTGDQREFAQAVRARFAARDAASRTEDGFQVYTAGGWRFAVAEQAGRVLLVSSDDAAALRGALTALGGGAARLDNRAERPGY
jgi:hypothetical protein